MPASMRRVVVFPAPSGPTSPKISPGRTSKLSESTAWIPGNSFVSPFATIADCDVSVMDGLMAIPSILLAIAVVSLSGASLMTVLVAITIPEIPRVARLVRSVVLSVRAAIRHRH